VFDLVGVVAGMMFLLLSFKPASSVLRKRRAVTGIALLLAGLFFHFLMKWLGIVCFDFGILK
ncbi:MAG: hypothetical protein K2X81_00025, partial [Candidatus Obscuribacterales bacterium]|nr:hypothetical protein [Candidatus Obscuribacterales bacterium]